MNRFIVLSDFEILIDEDNLNEVINEKSAILDRAIPDAIEEAACHIRHRYDEDQVFAIVNKFITSKNYAVNDRIIWSPDAYVSTNTYNTDDIVSQDDNIYQAKEDGITGSFDTSKWTLIVENKTHYYCIQATTGTELPNNTDYFTKGDSRNNKLVQVIVDIILYNLHSRITPRKIPELRMVRYDNAGNKKDGECAITWLEKVANGKITPDLQIIIDDDGTTPQNSERVSYGKSSTSKYKY